MEEIDQTTKLNWAQYFNPLVTFAAISSMFYLIGFTRSEVIARNFGIVNLTLGEPIQATIANGFMTALSHMPELLAIATLTFLVIFAFGIRRNGLNWVIVEKKLRLISWGITIASLYSTLGAYSGAQRSNLIIEIVTSGCKSDCRKYKTAEKSYLGLPIQGNDKYQIIYTKTGVVVLSIEKIQSIHNEGLKQKKLPVAWEMLPSFPNRD